MIIWFGRSVLRLVRELDPGQPAYSVRADSTVWYWGRLLFGRTMFVCGCTEQSCKKVVLHFHCRNRTVNAPKKRTCKILGHTHAAVADACRAVRRRDRVYLCRYSSRASATLVHIAAEVQTGMWRGMWRGREDDYKGSKKIQKLSSLAI